MLAAIALPLGTSPVLTVLAVAGATTLWAVFTAVSPALTGLGHARWTLFVNGPTNLAKLALLPVFVITVGTANHPAVLSTLAPAAIATAIVTLWVLPRFLARRMAEDAATGAISDWSTEENSARFFRFIRRDGPATGLNVGLGFSLSFIVTALAGPAQGALFALCFQFGMVLDLVGAGFGSALAVHAAGDTAQGRRLATRLWAKLAAVVAGGAALLILASPILFGIMGQFYLDEGAVMVLAMLAIASVLRTGYDIWCALLRAEHRLNRLLVFHVADAAILVPLVIWLTIIAGAAGAALAVLIVAVLLLFVGAAGIFTRPRKSSHPTLSRRRKT